MKRTLFFITLAMLLLLASCTTGGGFYSTSKGGKLLTVNLDGNPTTGYQWVSSVEGDAVEELSSNYKAKENKAGMVGVGGTYTFTFASREEGDAVLHFSYLRSWETEPPVSEKTLYVNVSPKGKVSVREEL